MPPPVQVIEWGGSVACGYAGKLLADAGIPVVRIAGPGSDSPAGRNPWFDAFLHGGKTSFAMPADPAARSLALEHLFRSSTLLLAGDDRPELGGLAPDARTVPVVSITPFGVEGPRSSQRAGDLELSAYSGLAYLTPRDIARVGDGRGQPPLKMPGVLPSIYAGAAGAAACFAVLLQPSLFQGRELDVSAIETLIPTLRRELALYQYRDTVASRFMRVWQLAPWGVKPCRDGFVFVQVVEEHHWLGLVEMMGSPQWALDERYRNPDYRFEHRQDIEARMAPWLLNITKGWFAWECQRRSLPFAPVNTVADVVRIPQLHFRQFFTSAQSEVVGPCTVPRLPYRVRTGPSAAGLPAGAPTDPRLPLAGVRVADFGHVWAGPYCAQILADLGAEVIKIESARRLDIHRRQGPYSGTTPDINSSGVWNSQNRGKGSATFDLASPEGRELAKAYVARCDVVIENFAPGVMHKLGLGYDELAAVNPGIVMVSLSAFGQDGPQRKNVGYGPSLDAWSGLDSQTAYNAGQPGPLGGVFPDTGSAIHGVVAILQGLHDRQRTGAGRYVDLSELEVSALLIADLLCEQLGSGTNATEPGNRHAEHYPYGTFPCAGDDEWVALTTISGGDWTALCELIGRPAWASDAAFATADLRRLRSEEIERAIGAWTLMRAPRECMDQLQARGLRAAAVNKVPDVLSDPHLTARGYFQDVAHPVAGVLRIYGPLWKVRGMERPPLLPAPVLGDATTRVLRDLLGRNDSEIEDLRSRKIAC